MPDGFPRFSIRDSGEDDWSSLGTYKWMDSNRALLPAVNDVSGEHGIDLGHTTHRRGTDIDIYHFGVSFVSPLNGGANFRRVRDLVIRALNGNQNALASIAQWFRDQRAGAGALANDAFVAQIRCPLGEVFGILPEGWAQSLFETGRIVATNGLTLNIGGGIVHAKFAFDHMHNTHFHIDLSDQNLTDTP